MTFVVRDLHPSPAAPTTSLLHAPHSPLTAIMRTCDRIAQTDATLLITGETGTGKEVVARYVHTHSARAQRNFVAVNCGAIPEALVESELFGHVKGAFTGASTTRKGRVAMAEGGTLFLDEIGELPLGLQVKLLRLLQERTYEPVGSAESVSANFRLIAATHRNLAAEVEAGRFRRDLYYRLLVCPVALPPLRERRMDVPALLGHFWETLGERRPVDASVYDALSSYGWPGNVRELENLAERLSVCAEGAVITARDLPQDVVQPSNVVPLPLPPRGAEDQGPPSTVEAHRPAAPSVDITPEALRRQPVNLPLLLRELEEAYISAALAASGGSKKGAADLLGLQRTTLVEKLRRREPRPAELSAAN